MKKKASAVKIDYADAFKESLKEVLKEYHEGGALKRLNDFPEDILSIEKGKNKYVMKPLFDFMCKTIEENGTGGNLFRNFYRDYFEEMGAKLNNDTISNMHLVVNQSCTEWSNLAKEFKNISEALDKYKNDKVKKAELYNEASKKAAKIYEAENKMIEKIKELYDKM